jgi:23S rRNA U2552 (ribose-2'-O)-methylase RlmE/FtsJ
MKIYYKQKNKIIKQIKYFKYKKEVFDFKQSVLFHFIYNKYSIINRNHIVNIKQVLKSNLLIDNNINTDDYTNNSKYKNTIVPLQQKLLLYNNITDKFIYYHILYNKYLLYIDNIKLLDLSGTAGLLETLLYNKVNFYAIKYSFNNNYILMNNSLLEKHKNLEDIYKTKINYNNEFMSDKLNINLVQKIISNENTFNLLFIDSTIHLQKYVKEEVDYNDYSYMETLYKLYLGLNLLDNGGKCILNIRSSMVYKNFLKNLLYFLLNFFDIKYKTIIKYNTTEILLDNFDKSIFHKNKNEFKNIILELEKKCMKEQLFLCHSNVPRIIKPKSYEIDNLFKYKYDKDYIKFFDYVYDKINNIRYMNKMMKNAIKLCPTLEKCFTIEKLLKYNYNNFLNNLDKSVLLLEKYNLIVSSEYKKILVDYDKKIENYNNNLYFNNIVSLTTNNIINFNYINTNNDIIYKFDIDKISKNLNLLKFCIESRNVNKWYNITTEINIRKYITNHIKNKYNIRVSRAFCKMYDILTQFPLIDLTKKEIKTFHACEAPGHFINAFNYWIKARNKDMVFDWHANSLNSYNEENRKKYKNIFSDDYGFIKKYKDRWDWASDNTGDISKRKNLLYYEKKYKDVDIFTSDCGLGANEDFEQECSLSFLSIAQLILGLMVLKRGGNLVCKIFIPFTKPLTISILYIYTMYFEKIHIIKQASGSLGSSEVYIIGLNKKEHLSEHNKQTLLNVLENIDMEKSLFDGFSDLFSDEINETSKTFIKIQEEYLNRSFFYYDNPDMLNKHKNEFFNDIKMKYVNKWIDDNNFKLIEDKL